MNKLLVAPVLFALFCGTAFAVDYHVLRDLDGDGNADPCPNADHQRFYASDSVTCGGSFDIDGDGVEERLFCNVQAAFDQAVNPGDSVEIHDGTYGLGDTSPVGIKLLCSNQNTNQTFAAIRSCASCSSESSRRIFRTASMNASVDASVTFSPGGGSGIEGGLTIGVDQGDNANFVTIQGLRITDLDQSACDGGQNHGVITAVGQTNDLIIDGVELIQNNSAAACSQFSNETGTAGFHFGAHVQSSLVKRIEIKNSVVDACKWAWFSGTNSVWNNCLTQDADFIGVDIHDNELHEHMRTDLVGSTIKAAYDVAIWNNRIIMENNSQQRFRQTMGNFYIFNNYIEGGKRYIFYQDVCTNEGMYYFFNNSSTGSREALVEDIGGTTIGANNSVTGTSKVYGSSAAGSRLGPDHFTMSGGGYATGSFQDKGGHVCNSSAACGAVSSASECSSSPATCDSNANTRPATGPSPWRLPAGSVLIDKGTNNPLGQGPGKCAITLWQGHTIDCTKDYDGDPRGGSWDIGADEFNGPVDPVCGNGVLEEGESCDGADLGGASCSTLGHAGGALACNTDCSFNQADCIDSNPSTVNNARRGDTKP